MSTSQNIIIAPLCEQETLKMCTPCKQGENSKSLPQRWADTKTKDVPLLYPTLTTLKSSNENGCQSAICEVSLAKTVV